MERHDAHQAPARLGPADCPSRRDVHGRGGRLEITYNSGARVILEGPATYTVDDRNGGFLRRGKATFLCGNGAAKPGNPASEKGLKTDSRLSPGNLPLLRVRVPRPAPVKPHVVVVQGVDIVLLVNEQGLYAGTLSPVRMAVSGPPLKKVVLPDYPSVVVLARPDGTSNIIMVDQSPHASKQLPAAAATASNSPPPKPQSP